MVFSYVEGNQCDLYPLNATYAIFDVINGTFVPFGIMLGCSIIIVKTIFVSRKKLATNSSSDNKRLRRDIQFSVTIVLINLNFLLCNSPIMFLSLSAYDGYIGFLVTSLIYFLQYANNVITYIFLNQIFKKELMKAVHFIGSLLKNGANKIWGWINLF